MDVTATAGPLPHSACCVEQGEGLWSGLTGDLFDGLALSGVVNTAPGKHIPCGSAEDDMAVASEGPEAFAHLRGRKPFVMRGLASGWPALSRWTEPGVVGTLSESGDDDVLVLRSRDDQRFLKIDCHQERCTLADVVAHLFVARTTAESKAALYARAPLSARVLADCDLSKIASMTGEEPKLSNCGLWLGSASNITPFHYDLCHGFLVQVLGTKTFTFVDPEQWRCLYPRGTNPELSSVDFERWRGRYGTEAAELEQRRHPRFARARLQTVTLYPGDALYTPPYWWHHVETVTGPAASVLVPFDQSASELALGAQNLCHHFS